MINLIKADFYKINHSVIYKVLFLVATAAALVTSYIQHAIYEDPTIITSAASAALFTDPVLLCLIGAVVAGQLICSDFDNKLVQASITGTGSRTKLVFAKAISYFATVGIMTLPYAIVSIVGFCLGGGYAQPISASAYLNMLVASNTADVSFENILKLVVISVIMMLIYAAQTAMVFLIAFIFKNKSILTILFGFIWTTACGMITATLASGNEKAAELLDFTPYTSKLVSGNIMDVLASDLAVIALVCVGILAVVTFAVTILFRKSEIK